MVVGVPLVPHAKVQLEAWAQLTVQLPRQRTVHFACPPHVRTDPAPTTSVQVATVQLAVACEPAVYVHDEFWSQRMEQLLLHVPLQVAARWQARS